MLSLELGACLGLLSPCVGRPVPLSLYSWEAVKVGTRPCGNVVVWAAQTPVLRCSLPSLLLGVLVCWLVFSPHPPVL